MTFRHEASLAIAPSPLPLRTRPGVAAVQRQLGRLNRQIEKALGDQVLPQVSLRRTGPALAELDGHCAQAIAGDVPALLATVKAQLRDGQTSESVCLDFLTPVARRLGQWWEEDRCGFVEVTLGLVALQQVLRQLAPGLRPAGPLAARRTALMLPLPGEQHSFGIAMVAEFFRAAGWQVWQEAPRDLAELRGQVAREWFGIVALSCGVTEHLARMPRAIAAVRASSLNPDVAVMVGGAALLDRDALSLAAGADATARDAAEALRRAEALVSLMAPHP